MTESANSDDTMHVSEVVARKNGVIFDLFFTLVSSAEIKNDQFPPTYEALGVELTDWREQIFSSTHRRLTTAESDPYTVMTSIAHAIDPGISTAVIREATDQRVARFERLLTEVPAPTLAVLSGLRERGLKTALITNADTIETHAWERSPMAPLFDSVAFSWRVGYAKPDVRIYQYSLDGLGLQASDCVFVGDGGSDELPGARAVGLTTVFATGKVPKLKEEEIRERELHADHVIGTLQELLPPSPRFLPT